MKYKTKVNSNNSLDCDEGIFLYIFDVDYQIGELNINEKSVTESKLEINLADYKITEFFCASHKLSFAVRHAIE